MKKCHVFSRRMAHAESIDKYIRTQICDPTFNNSDAVALRSGSLQIFMKPDLNSQVKENNIEYKNPTISLIFLRCPINYCQENENRIATQVCTRHTFVNILTRSLLPQGKDDLVLVDEI